MNLAVGTQDKPESKKTGRPIERFWTSIADRVKNAGPGKAITVQIPAHIHSRNFQTTARKSLLIRGLDCRVHVSQDHTRIIIARKAVVVE